MFYDEPPRCQINLETMEKLALERLRLLRLIEKTNQLHGGKVWTTVSQYSLVASRIKGKGRGVPTFVTGVIEVSKKDIVA